MDKTFKHIKTKELIKILSDIEILYPRLVQLTEKGINNIKNSLINNRPIIDNFSVEVDYFTRGENYGKYLLLEYILSLPKIIKDELKTREIEEETLTNNEI